MRKKGAEVMKINQDMRSQIKTKQLRTQIEGHKSFEQMIQSQTTKLKHEEIEHLMEEISDQGERLNRFRSVHNLVQFKRLIKSFLEKTVYDGLQLKNSHIFSLEGDSRKLSVVKEIDEKLVALTEEVMSHEEKTVDLLGLIGDIKGLLVNLYK